MGLAAPAAGPPNGLAAGAANPTQGAPQNSFGGPTFTTGQAGPGFVPPATQQRRHWLLLGLVALLVVALAGGGWWWMHRDAIVLPDHLGALALNTDLAMPVGQLSAQTTNGSVTSKLAAYGTPARTGLVVSRGPGVTNNLGAVPVNAAGLTHYGPVTCASGSTFIICLRAEGDLAVVVQTSSTVATEAQAADFVQEAWNAQ